MTWIHEAAALVDKPSAVTVGKFDGVHTGHRKVLRALSELAQARGLQSRVITFDRNPLEILRPERAPKPLMSTETKVALIREAGIDDVIVAPFTEETAAMTPESFCETVLLGALNTQLLLIGHDFRFGARGAGDLGFLETWTTSRGIELVVIDDVLGADGARASSTQIRALLDEGDVQGAATLLGRFPTVTGRVVHGEKRGRELGMPTANLSADSSGFVPADGVYAAWASVGDQVYPAAVSIGVNPTFDDVQRRTVEAHLLDVDLDLYGAVMSVEFVEFVRPMVKYEGLDALIAQMQADKQTVAEILSRVKR
ncbi:bifunctional riboflavin kinase/FAD synthetase [Humidisolicoccus flavus]|uniref:bifunctional riboflavin kinase/FAD synthetase n=1 Tax=Humidisolicoccus flavus TaxID=3111414 RepID=UPI00325546B3